MKRKKLVIISHTEHYKNASGTIVGWGATVNEVNFLADFWDEICHVGCLYNGIAPKSALPYTKNNIHFAAIPPYGGKSFLDKFKILTKIPKIIAVVYKNIKNASEIQLRLPTSMGLFLLPVFSFIFPRKYTFWVKYAGNWEQENPPLSYKLQRWWLKNNLTNCKVTINGFWENQPKHCLSFENPCLEEEDISKGEKVVQSKKFNDSFTLCFVGRLDSAKGVDVILESLTRIDISKVNKIHFIGDGAQRNLYEKQTKFLKGKVFFHGFLGKEKVHELLAASHFLLLPSKSEGFPKVIAEAACYGTIPVVSNVGSISHYINDSNGFLWERTSNISYDTLLSTAFKTGSNDLILKSQNCTKLAKKFTFAHYFSKIKSEVLL